jgi:NAD(P)-dependent dehydrogenase (short-subunit alcohol dehydrogenase family)
MSVAVVTGGNRGIGLEVCRQLAEHGFRVVLGSRDLDAGERAARPLGGDVVVRQLDISDDDSVREAAAWVGESLGGADAVINNAATLYDTHNRAAAVDLDIVREGLETNLFGPWRMAQAFLELLRASDHPRIVNVSSEGGSLASMGSGAPTYSVSKAALNALTRILASELRPDGILVNSVPAGPRPTWAGPAAARSPRAPPAWSGRRPFPTTAPRAASSGTDGHCPGSSAAAASVTADNQLLRLSPPSNGMRQKP